MLQRVVLHAGMGSELAAVSENDHEALNALQETMSTHSCSEDT
jgi:hypothetical protein